MKRPKTLPKEHPIKIPGKNSPAGMNVPYVIIVKTNQIRKKSNRVS